MTLSVAERAERDARIVELVRVGRIQREARRALVSSLHAAGRGRNDIARACGCTRETVRTDLIALGIIEDGRRRDPKLTHAILDLAATGMPYAAIGRAVGLTMGAVQRVAVTGGIHRGLDHRKSDSARDARLIELWGTQATVADIAAHLGMSVGGVKHACMRLDLPPRRRGRKPA